MRSLASVVRPSVRPSVCLSDVAYIGSNSKTKRPRKTKLCTRVPQVTCDSHTDFKVKRSKVKVGRGHIVAATIAAQLVGNALVSINVVTLRWARLVPEWVTVTTFGWVNYLSKPATQVNSAWPSLRR